MSFNLKSGNKPQFKNIGSSPLAKKDDGILDYVKGKYKTVKKNVSDLLKEPVTSLITPKNILNPGGTVVDLFKDREMKSSTTVPKTKKKVIIPNQYQEEKVTDFTPPVLPVIKKKKVKRKKRKKVETIKLKVITPEIDAEGDAKKKKEKDLNSNTPKNNTKKKKVNGMTEDEISKMPKGA
jgi:hypothetical protein